MAASFQSSPVDMSNTHITKFQSSERLQLLNDIDQFRAQDIDDLPQIVVCGDTSSGKSSVLQALSGIPFPTDSVMCTSFATEIALRYSSDPTITGRATITAAKDASDAHREIVNAFQHNISDFGSVVEIIGAAKEAMGINGNLTISKDILHLHMEGASLPDLTLVDLPGLIHSSRHQVDIDSVKELIATYFEQKNSIILNIVSAENPMESQGVLNEARRFDPRGEKSIGVITKPDQVDRGDKIRLRPAVLELARNQNETFKFKRPWHIVRCLSDEERAKRLDRQSLERQLFSNAPWSEFGRAQQGIDSLRKSLSEYLQERIIETLPELTRRLETRMRSVKSSLHSLGEERSTARQQQAYLTRLSQEYTNLLEKALSGDYIDSEFFTPERRQRKLRAWMMDTAERFEKNMREKGHSYTVMPDDCVLQESIDDPTQPAQTSFSQTLLKIDKLLKEHRGPELPSMYNPRLVKVLFVEQSRKWRQMAMDFADHIVNYCQRMLRDLLGHICQPANKTAARIWRGTFDQALVHCRQAFHDKIDELLAPITNGLAYCSPVRFQASLLRVQMMAEQWNAQHQSLQSDSSCLTFWHYSQAYYDVALETFIDNVVILGAENCVFARLGDCFSSAVIVSMDEEKLQALGGEDPEMIQERQDLSLQLATLRRAVDTCRYHMAREYPIHEEDLSYVEDDNTIAAHNSLALVPAPKTAATSVADKALSKGTRAESPSKAVHPIVQAQDPTGRQFEPDSPPDSPPATPAIRQHSSRRSSNTSPSPSLTSGSCPTPPSTGLFTPSKPADLRQASPTPQRQKRGKPTPWREVQPEEDSESDLDASMAQLSVSDRSRRPYGR